MLNALDNQSDQKSISLNAEKSEQHHPKLAELFGLNVHDPGIILKAIERGEELAIDKSDYCESPVIGKQVNNRSTR